MHKLFARQLAKAQLLSGEPDLGALGALVSEAYEQSDRDRRRTDRSISLMIDELDQLNRHLEQLVEERTAALREREIELQAQNMRFDAALNNMSQALLMFDCIGAAGHLQRPLSRTLWTGSRAGSAGLHACVIFWKPAKPTGRFSATRRITLKSC